MKQFKKLTQGIIALIVMLSPISAMTFFNAVPASAGVNQCTWTGGGTPTTINAWTDEYLMSDTDNWVCSVGSLPGDGYDLIFPLQGAMTDSDRINHDLSSTNTYAGIWMTDTVSCVGEDNTYRIVGNDFLLAGDITLEETNGCSLRMDILVNNVTLTSDISIINSGFLTMGNSYTTSTLNIGVHSVAFQDSSNGFLTLDSELIGSGNVVFTNTGGLATGYIWVRSNNRNYDGDITITDSQVIFMTENNFGLGSTVGTTLVDDGGYLRFDPQVQVDLMVAENITFRGAGPAFNSQLGATAQNYNFNNPYFSGPSYGYLNFPGNSVELTGTITIEANLSIEAQNEIIFSGNLIGPGNELIVDYGGQT